MRAWIVIAALLAVALAPAAPAEAASGARIVFTFDDGRSGQMAAASVLEQNGFRGTFYIVPEWLGDHGILSSKQVRTLATRGHEIGSHTQTHPYLTQLAPASLTAELRDSQRALEALLGKPVRHLAYPYGDHSDAVVTETARWYDSGRVVSWADWRTMDRYRIQGVPIERATTLDAAQAHVDEALAEGATLVLLFHDIRTTPQLYDWTPTQFQALVAYVRATGATVSTLGQAFPPSWQPPAPPPAPTPTPTPTPTPEPTPEPTPTPTPTPDPTSAFDATFRNVRGNEWWVETDVGATGGTLAGVDARVDGSPWSPLTRQSWGSWARSLRAPAGSTVQFQARSAEGALDASPCYSWPDRAVVTCGSGAPAPPPPSSAFDATFTNVRGNTWWVEADVRVAGGTLTGVDARAGSGAWTPLLQQTWGSWAKSMYATGIVQLRARSADGATDLSPCYAWSTRTVVAC